MAFGPGARLGPYEILSAIGAGGMGEVYRARDTRLDRDVAIKLLPDAFAADPDRLARFEREAKTLASLNHPNIVTIYSVETADGRVFLAMELVEGRPLTECIRKDGMPLLELLDVAISIADAVQAAHQRGVIHRDLKPGNIVMSADRRVKVLDFGLAKLAGAGEAGRGGQTGAPLSLSPTMTSPPAPMTGDGQVLGTAAYMSPEQAEGLPTDARSDIFSLGVILYELATGRRPFDGTSSASIITSILRDTPASVSDLNPALPDGVARIVRRCLAKDPMRRYQTALDLRNDLEDLKEETSSRSVPPMQVRRSPTIPRAAVLAGSAALVLIAIAAVLLSRGTRSSGSAAASTPAPLSERQLTSNPIDNPITTTAISPDAKYLAYADVHALHVRLIATGETRTLPVPAGFCFVCAELAWSPDGTRLLIGGPAGPQQKSGVWVVSTLTGDIRQLADDGIQPSFAPDATRIAFARDNGIWLMGADGENPVPWLKPEGNTIVRVPRWAPDGRAIAYVTFTIGSIERSIEVRPIGGDPPVVVVPSAHARVEDLAWVGDSMFYINHQLVDRHDLLMLQLDASYHARGPATLVTRWDGPIPSSISFSADARRFVTSKMLMQSDVYLDTLSTDGHAVARERQLTSSTRFDWPSAWSADGTQLLLVSNRDGTDDVFLQPVNGSDPVPLVRGKNARMARYSPDGQWLLYELWSEPEVGPGRPAVRLMRLPVKGGAPEVVFDAKNPSQSGPANFQGWGPPFPDFRCPVKSTASCVIGEADGSGVAFSAFDVTTGRRHPVARAPVAPNRLFWDLSPDGTRIAYVSWTWDEESPISILTLSDGSMRTIPTKGWTSLSSIAWAADGQSLFVMTAYRDKSELLRVDNAGNIFVLRDEPGRWLTNPRPAPDGRTLAFARTTVDSNVWLSER